MQVSVLGAGAWGTALALVLADNGHTTSLWTWDKVHAQAILEQAENRSFLPGVALPRSLRVTAELPLACAGAEVVLLVLPSHAVRETVRQVRPHVGRDVPFVCASKGIEASRLMLLSEVIQEERGSSPAQLAVLSGPSFAKEVARRVPTNIVAASTCAPLAAMVQDIFVTDWLRVYTSSDPVGVEIGGALKNVIAIAAGASDGLGLGENTRAALITRGIAEMARLVVAKGGQRLTVAGLAGLGDLVLTCTGQLSRNRALGFKLGQGQSVEEALRTSDGVAEGFITARSAVALADSLAVDLPICAAVDSVLHGGKSPPEALKGLLSRPLHAEWDDGTDLPDSLAEPLGGAAGK